MHDNSPHLTNAQLLGQAAQSGATLSGQTFWRSLKFMLVERFESRYAPLFSCQQMDYRWQEKRGQEK
jgi:hypothetical protein